MGLPLYPKPGVKHKDGTLWEASWEVSAAGDDLWAFGLFDKSRRFCFRQLAPNPKRKPWWAIWRKPLPRYVRTGKVWIGGSLREGGFKLL